MIESEGSESRIEVTVLIPRLNEGPDLERLVGEISVALVASPRTRYQPLG